MSTEMACIHSDSQAPSLFVGIVSRDDLEILLRQSCGTCLSDEEMNALLHKIFAEAGVEEGLSNDLFARVFEDIELNMTAEMPVYMASM